MEIVSSVLIAPKPGVNLDELEAVFAEFVEGVRTKDDGVPGYAYWLTAQRRGTIAPVMKTR